ncbi:MAG: hypothetical protein ISR59_05635 [Anaerolineales bacterium]|uniref:Uncharacterized protein n=1 Tax=Candidatus Desulfolinea nitratireducens TaxID=2841698 RepID=A0A8J6NJE5_9CHLR|nr:hypothetical protein [Candidatus Desulfolinea nitratireducens]MBL6960570.1 hypothetical protein [Anaerolineales bacterium]
MARKILSGILIALSLILLVLSLVGIGAAWVYNQPLTLELTARLIAANDELDLTQTALHGARDEMERALRFIDSAEESLEAISEQSAQAKEFLDAVTGMLDETITPSLEISKEKIGETQKTLDDLRKSIELINKIPFVNLEVPDYEILTFFIEMTNTLESEVDRVGEMAEQASTFLNDSSYLLGGDLQETRENIRDFMVVVDQYDTKIGGWREQLAALKKDFPGWVDRASIILTVFLLWFGFSQFGLFLHGLTSWRGEDPLAALRKNGE